MPPKLKLTPSQKLEEKLRKKAEKKQQLLERKNQIKTDHLKRELKYGELVRKKQEKNWRQLLINIKIPQMHQDLEVAWHNFEKIIDSKDFQISLLMDEVTVAEEQYFLNLTSHADHIDQLIAVFQDAVYQMDKDYKKEINKLEEQHEIILNQINCSLNESELYQKTMLHILNVNMKEVNQSKQTEYYSKLEEEDSKHNQLIHKMKTVLEQTHMDLWTDTIDFLNNYNERIKNRKKAHNQLKLRDDNIQKVIKNQVQSIKKSYDLIRNLKLVETQHHKSIGKTFEELDAELNFFTLLYNKLKLKLLNDQKLDQTNLCYLTINYNNVIDKFEKLEQKGKHLLQISDICSKFETMEEKIFPFPANFQHDLTLKKEYLFNQRYVSILELFWQRVGNATALSYTLNNEFEILLKENEKLRKFVHEYCRCLTCPGNEPIEVNVASVPVKKIDVKPVDTVKYNEEPMVSDDSLNFWI